MGLSHENAFLSVSSNQSHKAYQIWKFRANMLLPSLEPLAPFYWNLWFEPERKFYTYRCLAQQKSYQKLRGNTEM